MKPYYENEGITIYHGDCRQVLPQLSPVESVCTDPVWPNCAVALTGRNEPGALMDFAASWAAENARRLIVHLAAATDPRFLANVPPSLPFVRACLLEYARASYRGRIMNDDMAYIFGDCPDSEKGKHILSGRKISSDATDMREPNGHPTPRKLEHVRWLLWWYGGRGITLDPFMGSGTTLLAAKRVGIPAIGVEIEERWCEQAARRLAQSVMQFPIPGSEELPCEQVNRFSDLLTATTEEPNDRP
jgi:hypothetical protein